MTALFIERYPNCGPQYRRTAIPLIRPPEREPGSACGSAAREERLFAAGFLPSMDVAGLIDRSRVLRERARRYRLLATGLTSPADVSLIEKMADEFDARARAIESRLAASNDDDDGWQRSP